MTGKTSSPLIATWAVVSLLLFAGCSSAADGRKGNRLYEAEDYAQAAEAYAEGLNAVIEDPESRLTTRYFNNIGLSLYRQEGFQDAAEAFVQSAANTSDPESRSIAAYNAGNNAFRMDNKKLATDFYLQSLVADPTFVDAKINYEFVKRQMEDEEQQGGGQDEPPEPSEYALELKKQADELVAQKRYREAFQLMDEGRQIDPTVEAFATFIQRVASVADINEIPA